jgi:hypothetical protein
MACEIGLLKAKYRYDNLVLLEINQKMRLMVYWLKLYWIECTNHLYHIMSNNILTNHSSHIHKKQERRF